MTEIIDMTGDVENEFEDGFDYWYELENDDKEYFWTEFSYNKFDKKTTLDDYDLSEWDELLLTGELI